MFPARLEERLAGFFSFLDQIASAGPPRQEDIYALVVCVCVSKEGICGDRFTARGVTAFTFISPYATILRGRPEEKS